MLHGIMTAGFQNVIEANHVALDVSIRVSDGVTNTSLGTKIHNNIRVVLLEDVVDETLVRKVSLDECVASKLLKFCQTCFFDADIVVVVHVIQTDDHGVRLRSKNTPGKV